MKSHEIVLCHPVRTAIGAFNGSFRDVPATALGAAAVRETLRRAGGIDLSAIDSVVLGNVIQAGNRMNPARAGVGCGRRAGGGAGAHREPRVRLGRAGNREHRDRDRGGRRATGHRGRHGEHGPRAVSARRRPPRLPDGQRGDPRQHAARRPRRCVLRRAFRLAHGRPRDAARHHARSAGPLGRTFAAAFRGGAGERLVRCGDRRHRREGGQADNRVRTR